MQPRTTLLLKPYLQLRNAYAGVRPLLLGFSPDSGFKPAESWKLRFLPAFLPVYPLRTPAVPDCQCFVQVFSHEIRLDTQAIAKLNQVLHAAAECFQLGRFL